MRIFKSISLLLITYLFVQTALVAETAPIPENSRVARAMFTTGINDREPVNQVVAIDTRQQEIFFFTDIRNLQGRTIKHIWVYNGQAVSENEFPVGGPRWRVNSRKALDPSMTGKWTVWVVDESGWPLHASIFMYYPAR